MKTYYKEIIIILLQLLWFYLFPLFSGSIDPMGMVLIIITITFILAIIIGAISTKKIKYFYPILISILFIPSVFIYYNSSALVHCLWYLIDSYWGLFIGIGINKIVKKS